MKIEQYGYGTIGQPDALEYLLLSSLVQHTFQQSFSHDHHRRHRRRRRQVLNYLSSSYLPDIFTVAIVNACIHKKEAWHGRYDLACLLK